MTAPEPVKEPEAANDANGQADAADAPANNAAADDATEAPRRGGWGQRTFGN